MLIIVLIFNMIIHIDSWYWHFDSQAPVDNWNQSSLAFSFKDDNTLIADIDNLILKYQWIT